MQKFIISESDRSHILNLYGIVKDEVRPLQKLLECKYTPDGKYIMYENKIYSCQTGEEVPIMEGWSISDILHTGADLLSAGMDFVIPGSGAIVDALNALSYIIEAQFKPAEERDSLYTMAAITFAFVILPGPLQAVAPVLKNAIKTGRGFASKAVLGALEIIGKNLGTILGGIKNLLQKALQSKLARNILGKHGDNISKYIQKFYDRVKTIFDGVLAKAKGTKTPGVKATADDVVKKPGLLKTTAKELGQLTLSKQLKVRLQNFFKKLPKIKSGPLFLRKLGFVPGKTYRLKGAAFKTDKIMIDNVTDSKVLVTYISKNGEKIPAEMSIEKFTKDAIGAPWSRRGYSVAVPFFVKRTADLLNSDGSDINYDILNSIPDANPDQTSAESLAFMGEEVAEFEGDTGAYTIQGNVKTFQDGLQLLGYKLARFGADGKFGAETQEQLKKFQTDNGLTTSIGKMDRLTAKKIAELLKTKNIPNSQEIQNQLNKI
jgi:hypothetical protein